MNNTETTAREVYEDERIEINSDILDKMNSLIQRAPWKYSDKQELANIAMSAFFRGDRRDGENRIESAKLRTFVDRQMDSEPEAGGTTAKFGLSELFKTIEDAIRDFAREISYKIIENIVISGCCEVSGKLEDGIIEDEEPESIIHYEIPIPEAIVAHHIVN